MMAAEKNYFEELNKVDVSDRVEKKDTGTAKLSYLSWSHAWAEVKKRHPDAQYVIKKFGEKQLPYVYDELTGFMVFTEVTIEGITHEMWLPVMDSQNKAMLDRRYTYETKKGQRTVEPASMFDVNKTIMRCLTKNIGMHGLGLYIYAGEDLPENEDGLFEKAKLTKETAMKLKLTFGKNKGKTLGTLFQEDMSYINWLKDNDRTDAEIKEAIRLIEQSDSKQAEPKKDSNQKEGMKLPAKSINELNQRMKEIIKEIEEAGGDKKKVQRLYLETMGLPNFDNYNKTDFVAFLEDVLKEMQKESSQQGEMLKNGTTTANNNVIGWGTK